MVTGKTLAENCREYFSRPVSLILWVLSELAMMATDLAEFLGAALGFYILFNIPMFSAALITGVVVFGILWFYRFGYRAVEYIIIGLVLTIGFCYVIEIFLAKPAWGEICKHVVIPEIDSRSILVAVGMLGATVMPHNLFLHSGVIRYRLKNNNGVTHKKLFKFAIIDSIFALNGAWLVNSAIIIMSAAVFFKNGLSISTITEAHKTLTPLLGGLSSMAFAIALLSSGLSSSTTGTLAGQIVIEGFLKIKISLFLRRLVTMIPALIVIYIGVNELKILVLSQVFLSLALPFVTIPLIIFTWKKKIMGEYANRPLTNVLAILSASIIIFLNLLLLYQVFGGSF
ncbi:MAG TPA: Nramp family divalent metal transporter [candidate division Zixibacteria bacterium]|nr:Nramp family divalent metal transporter [candidate division Zixibacteria bacterium]